MRIKFLKDFRGKDTKEVFYPAGSVVEIPDEVATRLAADGFAEVFTGAETVVFVSPNPVVDPELQLKPTATGDAAAIIEKDNAAILHNLEAERVSKEVEVKAVEDETDGEFGILPDFDPTVERTSKPKRPAKSKGKKAAK